MLSVIYLAHLICERPINALKRGTAEKLIGVFEKIFCRRLCSHRDFSKYFQFSQTSETSGANVNVQLFHFVIMTLSNFLYTERENSEADTEIAREISSSGHRSVLREFTSNNSPTAGPVNIIVL